MAASNRSTTTTTNSSPSTGSDKSVLQHQDTNSSFLRPLCGTTTAFSAGSNTDSFHIGGYENAADTTPRPYHSNTDILSFEEVYPVCTSSNNGMMRYDDMFYHGNGVPSDFHRPSNSTRYQSSPQYYGGGDLYADDDARSYFAPFHSSNQHYPLPEPTHVSSEFLMSQWNEINSLEIDYMMRSTGNLGLRNGYKFGLKLNPFTGPVASSTRRSMNHQYPSYLDQSANDFDMGSPRRFDFEESAASLSYREQVYNQCRRASFSAYSSSSSPRPTWDLDYNNLSPPLDESRSASCRDFYHSPAMSDLLTERKRGGPRALRPNGKSKMITDDHAGRFCQQDLLLSRFRDDAKFFVIKSYSEDNVYKSMKYCVWASTKNGNKKLDAAYREAKTKKVACPVFLLFSVNASAQFCGVAEMVGPVDFETSVEYWQQDRWSGHFPVKWLIVKDVPNSLFRHIIIEDNDNKPVTNSRDTQEVGLEQGREMLNIFDSCEMRSSILDDFSFYEERQRAIQDRKARQQRAVLENLRASGPAAHHTSSLHEDYVREMTKSFAEALVLQQKLN
ncbi:uncharacterized protein LOC108820723 isoform X2 [Raphanus sativus]|uniref:YTH domain-containing family protein n=1 Tax=Raphanus sativus TaxID=3726 RepID=A0A6J0KNX1_RAPSA|nr:uncharacterized protein LOC108820723 isoform X2 [Raphanus sativus]